ncbi:MAG TPA: Gfo/Idh/MocA family oxidoreductase [Chloroflexota bacterium]|nr:Gfo/Idh/MocA family oxidoreductase [Chloroflexota bacterium]
MAKYRTAIIACGTIARVHARAWQGVPGQPVEIGAIADTHPDALREFGEFFGVPPERRYRDYREMLDQEHPDFVDVCSWHAQHAEMVVAAAARGPKAILCQKPMALSLGEAERMLVACQRNGVKLFIAFQRPHHATWLKARELIREGAIGQPIQVICDDGGNILNTNSHNIRLALYLLGEPRVEWVVGAVERATERMERGIPAEDACLGVAGCENGATILIMGNLQLGHRLGQGGRVLGTAGVMELDTGRPPDPEIPTDGQMYQPEGPSARYNREFGKVRYMNASTGGWREVEAPWHDAWAHQAWEAVESVEGRLTEPISDARHGYAVQEVMMALFESARRRQRVELPLKTRVNPLSYMVERGDLPVEWPGAYEVRGRIVRGEAMTWESG